jgi:hypothetical protein
LRYACAFIVTILTSLFVNTGLLSAQVTSGIYDDRDSHISYSGTWSQATQTGDYQGTHTWSNTVGSAVSLTFTGTQVTYVYPLYSSRGYAEVSIDGSVVTPQLDAYASTWVMQKLATYSGLANATHTITVSVLGTHDSQSSGSIVALDAFIVGTSFDDANPTVTYTGGWTTLSQTGDWNGTHQYITSAGSASFVFAGPFVTYVFPSGSNRGIASVSIDGAAQASVDEYSPATEPQLSVSFGGLSSGIHTIVISWTGQQDSSSSGSHIAVDQFITAETLYAPNVPAQEYIRFGGKVIAIENAGP